MAVDRLGSTASLIAALRAELARKPERTADRDTGPARPTQGDAAPKPPRDPAALRRELATLVQDVSAEDPQALDALRPRVIRSVLLWEFGQELREYREWQPMLERITQALERNDRHRADFAQMVRDLQR
jgi:hypothetical protein